MRALIIDDSRAMRKILTGILRPMGFEIAEAGNGIEALKALSEHGKFEIALVDWNMPEMDGFSFVQAVRADHQYDDMLLMMVTTEAEFSQVAKALGAGANEYVMKPFTSDVIREKLELLGLGQGLA